jgi:hypothetical protein
MKKQLITFLAYFIIGFLSANTIYAQTPEGFMYQAEARNTEGEPIEQATLAVKITIRSGYHGGYVVWEGEHEVTTDNYGLFTLTVGEGTGGAYKFTDIDWSENTYFLNVMIYDCGAWVDMGTTQFLSVPYALHAKTVENIIETDPLYSASEAVNITETDIRNLGNLSGINTGDQDISDLATQAALEDTTSAIRSSIPEVTFYSVGDFAQGGIVFWVDESRQHGLVCAKTDQSMETRWHAGTKGSTQARGMGLFSGEMNTAIIVAAHLAIGDDGDHYAARLCAWATINEGGVIYGDWYLPSKDELELMYKNRATINTTAIANGGSAFANTYYWSSTEINGSNAWIKFFASGYQGSSNKGNLMSVRAIRAF